MNINKFEAENILLSVSQNEGFAQALLCIAEM